MIELDENLETILICAERYACGRKTYMPSIVVEYITALIPKLSVKTLTVLRNDITEQVNYGTLREPLGDSVIDAPLWRRLRLDVVNELKRRAEEKGDL